MRSGMLLGLAFVFALGIGCDGGNSPKGDGAITTKPARKPAENAQESQPPATPPESPTASEAEARARAKEIVNEITRHLMGVTTGEVAKAVATPLAPLAERLQATMTELKQHARTAGSGDLTRAVHRVVEDVRDLVQGPLRTAIDKLRIEIRRISANAECLAPLASVIDKIEKALQL